MKLRSSSFLLILMFGAGCGGAPIPPGDDGGATGVDGGESGSDAGVGADGGQPERVVASAVTGVRFVSSAGCFGQTCHTLAVACEGLPERSIVVRESLPAQAPIGTLFFTTGGRSDALYSAMSTEQRQTVTALVSAGFQVFEVSWKNGWPAGAEGAGVRKAMCGYERAVRWALGNKATNLKRVCAQGNSAGSFQIAYGLAAYGLDELLDMVVLTGGPPVSRVDASCFGTTDPALVPAIWPVDAGGRNLIDLAMGWVGQGDYCKAGAGPASAAEALRTTSLVSPTEPRDYDYPHTKVNFINSEADSTAADECGRLYSNAITTAKSWYEITGTQHEVDSTSAGGQKIRELLLSECVAW